MVHTYRLEILEPTLAKGLWLRRSFEATSDEEARASAAVLFEEYALDATYAYILYENERIVHRHAGSRRRMS